MQFIFKTRGNTNPVGKRYIYVHAMQDDELLRDKLIYDILDFQGGLDYALWYSDMPAKLFNNDNIGNIQHMNLFVLLVTDAMLANAEVHRDISLETLSAQGLPVLPVFAAPEVIPQFNRRFGDVHGVTMTAREYHSQLETQITNYLVSDTLTEAIIADAFIGQVFLSYRKKDYAEARRIMKAMHDTPWSESLAIWYDEFLTAGRDFNAEIQHALEESDIVALTVTPNLLEKDNYVCNIEYPNAVKAHKRIIPIEAVRTDRVALESFYDGIPPCVPADDPEAVAAAVRISDEKEKPKKGDPYLTYLLGMAYLIGLRVEKDVERAHKMLDDAAAKGIFEAAQQLGMMYLRGIGVKRSISTSIKWKERAFDLAEKRFEDEPSFLTYKRVHDVLESNEIDDGLAVLLASSGQTNTQNEYCERFLGLSVKCCNDEEERLCSLWRIKAYHHIADLHFENNPSEARIQDALRAFESGISICNMLNSYDHEAESACAGLYSILAEIRMIQGDNEASLENEKHACELYEKVVSLNPTINNRQSLALSYSFYGQLLRVHAASNQDFSEMQRARIFLQKELAISEQLYREKPSIRHRESLAGALYNNGVSNENKRGAVDSLKKGRKIIADLETDIPGLSSALTVSKFDSVILQMRRRRIFKAFWLIMLLLFAGLVIFLIKSCA